MLVDFVGLELMTLVPDDALPSPPMNWLPSLRCPIPRDESGLFPGEAFNGYSALLGLPEDNSGEGAGSMARFCGRMRGLRAESEGSSLGSWIRGKLNAGFGSGALT